MSDKLYVDGKKGFHDSSKHASRFKIKGRKRNRYMLEKESDNVSTFAKKLKTLHEEYDINVSPTFEYRFIDFLTVFSILQILMKKVQNKHKLHRSKQERFGL